jgi:hypothetical protein
MLGTHAIKQYFSSGTTHYVTPLVSAEWNYNLFYQPFTTFAGDGVNKSTYTSWTWTTAPTQDIVNTKNGGTALKFGSVDSKGHGTSKSTVNLGSAATNTYKIVFYAKVLENVEVNLTALAYVDYHRSGSDSKIIDGTQWTKFEMFVSSRPTDLSYSAFDFTLDYTSTDNISSSYHILIDIIEIYQTTEFDYQYGELWQTKAPFGYFRPGESYVPSGNSLTPLPTNFRTISTPLNSDAHTTWSKQMPCSPVVYHPRLLGLGASNPLYKNGLLSDFSEYKYFVSDSTNKYIGAVYEKEMASNKIVLKFNLSYATPTINIRLYNTVTSYDSGNISVTPSASGVVILYRQTNGTWTTTPWSTMPTFDLNGSITNSQLINKVIINQTSTVVNSNYSSSSTVAKTDMERLQVIEISPRLELDLTYFTMNVDSTVELDNKTNPLPISAMSANSASIQLSNVPLKVSGGLLSIFSNNATGSPLKGLFKKNVKFYINYIVRDQVSISTPSDVVIPGGIYYADTWEGQDIERTHVSCYDISHQLQLKSPTDYVSQSQSMFNIITNILDFAGFTDYDYDSLKSITTSNKQPITSTYFYANGQSQKVFDVLRELFEVYQVGAYIDAYGVMKFLSLDNIVSNKTPNLLLHDNSISQTITDPKDSQTLVVSPNIVTDTYTETVKVKLGKATLRYRTPNMTKVVSVDGQSGINQSIVNKVIQKNDALWTLEKDQMVTFNYLAESIDTVSQNYFKLDPLDFAGTFTRIDLNHDGYAIIEDEIVSFRNKEFNFSTKPAVKSNGALLVPKVITGDFVRTVTDQTDLNQAIAEFSEISGYGGTVIYGPTGRIMNIERGLFNTPVRTHKVVSNETDLATKMSYSGPAPKVFNNKVCLQNSETDTYRAFVYPIDETNTSDKDYHTFSVKMDFNFNSQIPHYDTSRGGIQIGNFTVYIEKTVKNKIPTAYKLFVYKDGDSVINNETGSIDITSILKRDADLYVLGSPMEELGKIINLKVVKNLSSNPDIYINKNKIDLNLQNGVNFNWSGTFGMACEIRQGSGYVAFTELYATKTPLYDKSVFHHYQLQSFMNAIVGNHKIFETSYMFQPRPEVVGITKHDISYSSGTSPSMTAWPLKAEHSWYFWQKDAKTMKDIKTLIVEENDMSYSHIHHTGFKGRILVINNRQCALWLKKSTMGNDSLEFTFSINTNDLISLSEEVIIDKIFDETNIAETVEIKSNWVQSKAAANGILNTIFKAVDGFSRDTEISVYGNPLFEIGDVVKINYSLKNISDQIYFVQAVRQTFDSGLKTVLTLNQIG